MSNSRQTVFVDAMFRPSKSSCGWHWCGINQIIGTLMDTSLTEILFGLKENIDRNARAVVLMALL